MCLRRCNPVEVFRAVLSVVLVSAAVALHPLSAQPHDSKGTEFWVAFMENYGSGGASEGSDLRLYLNCQQPTTAKLYYSVTGDSMLIPIPVANRPVEVPISGLLGSGVELRGNGQAGEISKKSFRVVAEDEITLYGVNIREKSSDAFLALPEDAMTRRYVLLAYPNGFEGFNDTYDMPSEFAVIATEDGTLLRIEPKASINGRPNGQEFTVGLNRGEVFFGQAGLFGRQDVTGTVIRATKPVAVYAGNRRTAIPTTVGNYRDHLVEQMPPMESWGSEAILTPHYDITTLAANNAVARIVAALDGTSLTLTSQGAVRNRFLNAGQVLEIALEEPIHVKATGPIMVAQYEHSVGLQNEPGDPFMMVIPPPEQYDTAYSFQSVIHPEFSSHFINVVIATAAVGSLELDDAPVNGNFLPVPGTDYSYAQIRVSQGAHYIRADSGFGLCAYGYGEANSYGYTGGILFRTLVHDFEAPGFDRSDRCSGLVGFFVDDRLTDEGIDSCYLTDKTFNADVTIDSFESGTDSVRFFATLVDPYQDGAVGLKAIDLPGRSRSVVMPLPGFTLRHVGMTGNDPVMQDTLVVFNGGRRCHDMVVENYGAYPRSITRLMFDGPSGLSISTPLPVEIPPGEQRTIEVCFDGWVETPVTIAIAVGDSCIDREVALLPVISAVDTTGPLAERVGESCEDELTVTIDDTPARSSGIASMTFDELVNCEVVTLPLADDLPANSAQVRLRRLDARRDVIYQITMEDVLGNRTVLRDTIGGFTLSILAGQSDTMSVPQENVWDGDTLQYTGMRCDPVRVMNYGLRTLRLTHIRMDGNLTHSIPPSQLPLVIPPGSIREIEVCLEGQKINLDQWDTLLIYDECGRLDLLPMKVPVIQTVGDGIDRCNNSIGVTVFAPAKRTFLQTPVPNPVDGAAAYVDLGLTQPEQVTLALYDLEGNPVHTVLGNIELDAGINRVEFAIPQLGSGAYFCVMTTRSGKRLTEKMVVR